MRDRALLMTGAAAAAALLGACDARGPQSDPERPAGEHIIDPVTGETRMTIHGKDGPSTLRAGPAVPVSLPPGFSLFAGATVVGNAVVTRPGGQGAQLDFAVDAPAEAVLAHHRGEAERAGFVVGVELDTGDTRTIAGTRASDGATFALTVKQGAPATAQLTIMTGTGAAAATDARAVGPQPSPSTISQR